jgi:hypothetical protein
MTAMFDFRTVRDIVGYPIRLVFGDGQADYLVHTCREPRRPIILRWRRGDDGKLESHWECGE